MSARALATVALALSMALLARRVPPAFLATAGAGALLLAIRFVAVERLLGGPMPPRARRIVNATLLAALWLGMLALLALQCMPEWVFFPVLVTAGAWLLLDQPATLVVDALLTGAAALVAISALALGGPTGPVDLVGACGVGAILLVAVTRIERSRVLESGAVVVAPGRRAGGVGAAAGAGAAAALIAGFVAIEWAAAPRAPREPAFTRTERISGFTTSIRLGQLGALKLSDAVALEASFLEHRDGEVIEWRHEADADAEPGGRAMPALLLRGKTYDRLAMDGVSQGAGTPRDDGLVTGASPIRRLLVDARIRVTAHGKHELFALADAVSCKPPARLDGAGGVRAASPVESSIAYTVQSAVLDPAARAYLASHAVRHPDPRYLQVPEIPDAVRALAREITEPYQTGHARAEAIERFLKEEGGYAYSRTDDNRGPRSLETFLLESKSGHCEYFACAMALLLRSVGLPARVAGGYRDGTYSESLRGYRVLQRNAHSWVEVPYEGVGWVPFDPTPPEWALDVDLREAGPEGTESGPDRRRDAARAAAAAGARRERQILGLLAAGLAALLLGRAASALWKARAPARPVSAPRLSRPERGLQGRLLALLRRLEVLPRPPATLRELVGEARALAPERRSRLLEVVELLYRARFGGAPLTPSEIEGAERVLRDAEGAPA